MTQRCEITNNPCGTDTWTVGHPCQCLACQKYLGDENERLRKLELFAKLLVGVWECYRGTLPEPIIDELVRLRETIKLVEGK